MVLIIIRPATPMAAAIYHSKINTKISEDYMKKLILSVVCICLMSQLALAGNLNPTTPPTAGTMKPLDEVEPRTPITSVPYTISQSGSYYLTKNLTSTGTAITISADNVTIDLCGFTLTGPGSGATYGIYINMVRKNIEIHHGTIKNFGYDGIASDAGTGDCRIIGVQLMGNKRHGIYLSDGIHDIVKDCTVYDNGGSFAGNVYGIYIAINSTAVGNKVHSNGSWATGNVYGIIADDNCTVTGNTVHGIGLNAVGTVNGIKTKVSSSIIGNTVRTVSGIGIVSTSMCQILENRVTGNSGGISSGDYGIISRNVISQNASYGISAGDYVMITDNNVSNNQGSGITCTGGYITKNTVSQNNTSAAVGQGGIVVSKHSQVKENTLEGNAKNNIYIGAFRNSIEGNVMSGSDYGINFAGTGNVYINNRATCNGTNYNAAGNTDGGGNISF
jgi:hypothetical protein